MIFSAHPNFTKYDGQWADGTFEGQGQLALKNGEYYIGEWSGGQRSGFGLHSFAKTDKFIKYQGNWSNDLFDGVGVLTLYDVV